jgi:hypothetical protein
MLRSWSRASAVLLQKATPTAAPTAASTALPTAALPMPQELQSAYQLLRLLLRSAELKIRSRQARQFMKRRIVTQWRIGRYETDPVRQRALMERAAAVLQVMHVKNTGKGPEQPTELDFTNTRHSRGDLGAKP